MSLLKTLFKKISKFIAIAVFVLLALVFIYLGSRFLILYNKEAIIRVSGDEIVYVGQINKKNMENLFKKYEESKVKPDVLHISSGGGYNLYGAIIGDWVIKKGLKVKVTRRCISACANYIFTAGVESQTTKTAVVAWHGDFTSELVRDANYGHLTQKEYIEHMGLEVWLKLLKVRDSFFEKIGVDSHISTYGENDIYSDKNNNLKYDGEYDGFYYSIQDMKEMGLNIKLLDGTWDGETFPNNGDFRRFYLVNLKDVKKEVLNLN